MFALFLCCTALCDERAFVEYLREHNMVFTGEEYKLRYSIFESNLRLINEHNAKKSTFKMGLNRFAVLTQTEYRSLMHPQGELNDVSAFRPKRSRNLKAAPESCDWRDKGIVTPVADIYGCTADWAYVCANAAESVWAIDNGLTPFSPQMLLDCTGNGCDCNGGYAVLALTYVDQTAKYFMAESDYPYTAQQGECKFDASKGIAQLTGYWQVEMHNEEQGVQYLAEYGPSMNMMDATQAAFQLYASGIYDDSKCNRDVQSMNVGVVGYGTENGVDYWIVRNGWGSYWGENGYCRMIRGKNDQCGLINIMIIPSFD